MSTFSVNTLQCYRFLKSSCMSEVKRKCHSVFGLNDLIHQEKLNNINIMQVKIENHHMAVEAVKRHFLSEHVLVRSRNMNLDNDQALDEYIINLFKQGNSIYAMAGNGELAGVCVNFACSPVDSKCLRNYAFYRQDPNTKDLLYFIAKLQETPNLWQIYKTSKIFEIKMLAVMPEFRRQGLAVMLAEKSKELAQDQGYNVVRMDCINPFDYKVAERCMLHCVAKFPLHKLRGANTSYIKRDSFYNRYVRVYVHARSLDFDVHSVRAKLSDCEDYIG